MNMNRIRETIFIILAILGLAVFLMDSPALAQTAMNRSVQSSPALQTAAQINQRLQQDSDKLAGPVADSQAGESRIGPDDLLNITVFEAPEMNSTVRVSA